MEEGTGVWRWYNWVWSKGTIPKHSYISWLALHRRLFTKDMVLGLSQDDKYLLCGESEESATRLFFQCVFSQQCLQGVVTYELQQWDLEGIWRRVVRNIKGRGYRELVLAVLGKHGTRLCGNTSWYGRPRS